MKHAFINNQVFEVITKEDRIYVNGKILDWDFIHISGGHYHILYDNKSFRTELVNVDHSSKTVTLKINGNNHTVKLKDRFDLLLEKMGISNTASNKLNHIKAPMPGLIIDLKVKIGDDVKTGDSLLILEAMKMENILKSPGDGKVKNVIVAIGESVEKGQVLVEF